MSSYVISLPCSPSTSPSQPSEPTNTVAVTSIPKEFFHPHLLDILRAHFDSYGDINQWVPLPGFGRIIVVFTTNDAAELAKRHCDPIVLKGRSIDQRSSQTILRVFRADPNPIQPHRVGSPTMTSIPEGNYLRPPAIEKNFLISPPGSPPVGWEPIMEDPPNATPLAEDLMEALRRLKTHERHSSLEVLLDPKEGSGVGVYVENCDGDDDDKEMSDDDWVYGETAPAREKWIQPTAMPPLRATIVA